MKHMFFAFCLCAISAMAQPVVSPEVHPDGRVTFRLFAPDVKQVQLYCEGIPGTTMQKDDRGLWTFTSKPLEPDIYAYSYQVDGVHVLDPANPSLKYNLLSVENQVEVPGPGSLPWQIADVPHGVIHQHFYRSAIAGDQRDFFVYTPPGYNPSATKRYPVLYLLHGYSDDATAWAAVGRANVILDNLIARGQAKPMLVVMPLGYGTMDVLKAGWNHVDEQVLWQTNLDLFTKTLLDEVMPRVEKDYRVLNNRQSRAIVGLSMGGAESLLTGLNHLDRFAWIGAFSSGGLNTNYTSQFPALNAADNSRLRLLWISCGRDDGLLGANRQFCHWLDSQGVHYKWVETDGAHSWRVWRRNLAALAPLLFQNGKSH